MDRLRALDLFCGAGGVSMGLHRAGFDVTGVDIRPQPNYPFPFIRGDAMAIDPRGFDFIWASPPCQRFTDGAVARMAKGAVYPDLIKPTRQKLIASGAVYAIENVMKAPIRQDLVLHGHMFPGLRVIRRRKFELSWGGPILTPPLPKGLLREGFVCAVGNGTPSGVREMGLPHYTADQVRAAMGIDWMTRAELSQAIPPAYAEFIGRAALAHLRVAEAA